MFGFSLTKLLFTLAAIVIVWNGFKWYNRMQEKKLAEGGGEPRRAERRGASPAASGGGASGDAEEMVKCPVCETYVSSSSAVSCGRNGCPYPG